MTLDGTAAAQLGRDLAAWGEELGRTAPLPGGVIALTAASGPPVVSAFGTADLRSGTPMRPGQLFQIGSISKVFTSLLVNLQIDAGRLAPDTAVPDVLPWVEVAEGRGAQLTVERLLNHTSGLAVGADPVPDELEQAWILRQLVTAEPGHFHYSNLGYVLLGLVLRAITGQSVADLLAGQLFGPLGMNDSRGAVLDPDRDRYATGHQPARSRGPWVPGDPIQAAPWFEQNTADGNIASTAADLSRLALLLLGRGAVDGQRVVSEAVLDRMTAGLAPEGEPVLDAPGVEPATTSRYGLGINVEEVAGHRVVSHGGGMVGYSTFFLTDLDAGLGVVVLTNANGDAVECELLARAGHAALTDTQPRTGHWWPPAETRVPASSENASLTGVFAPDSDDVPDLVVTTDEGFLVVEQGGGRGWLFRDRRGRYATDHPRLRDFPLRPEPEGGWSHGPCAYDRRTPESGLSTRQACSAGDAAARWAPLVGRYRSFSPWYPTLRLYVRQGRLLLSAPDGVEAPLVEEELFEVSPGIFRIGAEAWIPERLQAGPEIAGHCVYVVRDGCHYSRTFLP